MANIRILHNNIIRKVSSVAASSTSSGYPTTNLLSDLKSYVWRSANTSIQTITLTWEMSHAINCAVVAFTNLSLSGRVRVRVYTEQTDTAPVLETGWKYLFDDVLENLEWGVDPLGENLFTFEESSTGAVWFPSTVLAKKVEIQLWDTTPKTSFIEVGCLAVGAYWSPERGCEYGCEMYLVDTSEQARSEAGDMRVDRGTTHRRLSVDVAYMTAEDKAKMWKALSRVGKHSPLYVSVIPEADVRSDEQLYQIYGRVVNDASIAFTFLDIFDTSLEIEEL